MNGKWWRAALLVLAVSYMAFLAVPATAATITGTYSGVITLVDAPIAGAFTVGQSFTGVMAFTTTGTDLLPALPNSGFYTDAFVSLSVLVGSYAASASSGQISILNNECGFCTSPFDEFALGSFAPTGPPIGVYNLTGLVVRLFDILPLFAEHAFTDDSLPGSLPDLSLFETTELELAFYDGSTGASARGVITSIGARAVATPGPAGLLALALGALLLGVIRRRFSHSD